MKQTIKNPIIPIGIVTVGMVALIAVGVSAGNLAKRVVAHYETTHTIAPGPGVTITTNYTVEAVVTNMLLAEATNGIISATNGYFVGITRRHSPELHIEWVGKVVAASDTDKWTPAGVGWLPQYELGLRSDGVVVWRKAEK